MAHGGSQQGSRLLESTDAGERDDVGFRAAKALHLEDERGHAIDAGIARRYDTYRHPLFGIEESLLGTLTLMPHARVHTLCIGSQPGGYEREITSVTYDNIAVANGPANGRSDIFG